MQRIWRINGGTSDFVIVSESATREAAREKTQASKKIRKVIRGALIEEFIET